MSVADTPKRIQLSRKKGWRMPENTVSVARPGRWGNPYRLDADNQPWSRFPWRSRERAQACVDYYRKAATEWLAVPYTRIPRPDIGPQAFTFGAHLVAKAAPHELRGKNLACWCRLCEQHRDGKPFDVDCPDCAPCHADVLLDLANSEITDAPGDERHG